VYRVKDRSTPYVVVSDSVINSPSSTFDKRVVGVSNDTDSETLDDRQTDIHTIDSEMYT